jgi:putative FmdB family regulatory protein
MPLYEYQCDACAHRFEVIRKFSDPPLEACPQCGGSVRKLVSSPAFQFKGTGWYITDYARKPSGDSGAAAGSGSGSKDGASSGDAKSTASGDKGTSGSADTAPASGSTSSKPS